MNPLNFLTSKEIELIKLMTAGYTTNDELANLLCLSTAAIQNRISSIKCKLGLNDRAKLVIIGIGAGFPFANYDLFLGMGE